MISDYVPGGQIMKKFLCAILLMVMLITLGGVVSAADIFDAILSGNLASVKALVAEKAAVVKEKEGILELLPLHVAVMAGNPDMVKFLVESKADINGRDKIGMTALHYAAALGSDKIVAALIEKKASVNLANDHGWTPLQLAIAFKHAATADLLLKQGGTIGSDRIVWEDPNTMRSNVTKKIAWEKHSWDVVLKDGRLEIKGAGDTKTELIDNGVTYFAAAGTGVGPVVVYKVGNEIMYYHKDEKGHTKRVPGTRGDVLSMAVRGHENGCYVFGARPNLVISIFWVDSRGPAEKGKVKLSFKREK
jgi:hypothetical protein